jgi:hypothetical protein
MPLNSRLIFCSMFLSLVFSQAGCGGVYEKQTLTAYEVRWVRTGSTLTRTKDEVVRFQKDLANKVHQYIEAHSEMSEFTKANLRNFTVTSGMMKDQVQFVLGDPRQKAHNPEGLPDAAIDAWKDTDEAWLYRISSSRLNNATAVLYFRDNILTHMLEFGDYYLLP